MKNIGCVYLTTCSINNKKYIGSCLYSRKSCKWETYLGSGKLLKQDIKKYGKEYFSKIILDESTDEKSLRELEEFYIRKFNAVESSEFYNMKYSAIGGDTFTYKDENQKKKTLSKMSKSLSGKNNPMYGRDKTQKMIDSVKNSNSTRISCYGVEYSSFTQAMKELGITRRSDQYRFRLKFDDPNDTDHIIIQRRKSEL